MRALLQRQIGILRSRSLSRPMQCYADHCASRWLDNDRGTSTGVRASVAQLWRGRGTTATTGYHSDPIVPSESAASGAAGLKGLVFCRLNEEDLQTWIPPALMLRTDGSFDPVLDFNRVRDVPTLDALVKEVADKQCAGAIPGSTIEDYTAARDGLIKILMSSPESALWWAGRFH